MMTRHLLSTIGLSALLLVAGCGGGGDDPAPPAGGQITIAAGGTISSDDGKLQLIVSGNSASAEGTATIVKAVPPAEMAADPGYVPDSAYTYSGPDMAFDPPASWELASARAVAKSSGERKLTIAAAKSNVDVERLCVPAYAQGLGQRAQAVWVRGGTCPSGCSKLRDSGPAPAPAGSSLCEPVPDLQIVAATAACPAGTNNASAEPAWAGWATDHAVRVCDPGPSVGAALLGTRSGVARSSCATLAGRFACQPPQVTSGLTTGMFTAVQPPKSMVMNFDSDWSNAFPDRAHPGGWAVIIPDRGTVRLKFRPVADDSDNSSGLAGVELRELKFSSSSGSGGATSAATSVLLWKANYPFNTQGQSSPAHYETSVPAVIDYGPFDSAVRYIVARAYNNAGSSKYSSVMRIVRHAPEAPVIASFSANPNALPIGGGGGATTLVWAVNGATSVNILPSIGNVVNPSSGSAIAVVTATTVFTLTATGSFGQTSTSNVIVTVAQDTTPPAVTLASTAASVIVPAHVTLTATASDAIGVAKVEFYRGATLIATDTAAPYLHGVSFAAADVGPVSFTARAYDAAGNIATSTPVVVSVTDPPGNGDTYAGPSGVDAGNTSCAQATPCLTIAKAASLAQPNKTVWLLNGEYKVSTQPVPINIPASLTLSAVNPGLAGIGQGIVLQGSGNVIGVVIRRNGFFAGDQGYIQASSGTIVLDGVRVIGSAFSANGLTAAISLSGTAQATMAPGTIADYADQLTPIGQGGAAYATLTDSARLTVNGGFFGGAALGGSADLYPKTGAFTVSGAGRLDLNNVVLNVDSYGVVMNGGATQLHMTSSTLHANANSGFGAGIFALAGTPQITLVASTLSGFAASGSRGISVGPAGNVSQPGAAATVSLSSASVIDNTVGIWVADGNTPSALALTGNNVVIGGNTFGGVICQSACNIDLAGGEIKNNGSQNPALVGSSSFYGGIWLGLPTKNYFLKLRNVQVVDNKSLLGGNSNQLGNSGITMAGTATSAFDLGSGVNPGGNIFAGNTTGSETTSLNVGVAPGVTVRAAGNTFIPGTQGANAQGKYQIGTAPCGPSNCDLTSTGSGGINFRITSGTLRLAE